MSTKIDQLDEHCDTLESFSRRDNLRLYGIPQNEQFENHDMCAALIADILNSVEAPKKWTADDFLRAHRVGESRNGQPKPMIVKFNRWRDKMTVLRDQDYRARLKEKGVRVANDLTRKQASIVAQARKEGKVAFFRGGRLTVGPKQLDTRTYAEVAAATADVSGTRETPANDPACSATRSRGRKFAGDAPSKGQRQDSDSSCHRSDIQLLINARDGCDNHHYSGGHSSVTENRGHGPGSGNKVGGGSPRLSCENGQCSGSHDGCHSNSTLERTGCKGRGHETEEHCGRGEDSSHQANKSRQCSGAQSARGGGGVSRGGGSGQGQSHVNASQSLDSVGRGGGSRQGQSHANASQSTGSWSAPAGRISSHNNPSRLRRSARTTK